MPRPPLSRLIFPGRMNKSPIACCSCCFTKTAAHSLYFLPHIYLYSSQQKSLPTFLGNIPYRFFLNRPNSISLRTPTLSFFTSKIHSIETRSNFTSVSDKGYISIAHIKGLSCRYRVPVLPDFSSDSLVKSFEHIWIPIDTSFFIMGV